MELDYYEYTIAEHWASPLVNGDGDLSEEEQSQLDTWLGGLPEHLHIDVGDESAFCVDEISGLYAQCVTCRVYVEKEENKQ